MGDICKACFERRPDFEEVLARLQPLHDELRARRRTSASSLATASAPGVSRALARGLLDVGRTKSSDLRDDAEAAAAAAGVKVIAPPRPPLP